MPYENGQGWQKAELGLEPIWSPGEILSQFLVDITEETVAQSEDNEQNGDNQVDVDDVDELEFSSDEDDD